MRDTASWWVSPADIRAAHVAAVEFDGQMLDVMIRKRAGNTGELIFHNDAPDEYVGTEWAQMVCPFCGCRSWFSFMTGNEATQGDDVFECLRCLATITRFDVIGKKAWDEMKKREADRMGDYL